MSLNTPLNQTDFEIDELINQEINRQQLGLEMIPSENYVSRAVLESLGSVLTNKYSEGFPGKRYYGGCEIIDKIENLAKDRAKTLFGVNHANVQPYSGSPANLAVYSALLSPGDVIMGQDIAFGGHLTHGAKVSFSGKWFEANSYKTDLNGWLDYDDILIQAKEVKPKMIIAGASAYPRIIDWQKFRDIADEVGAWLLVDMAHVAGLVVAGVHPSPCGVADVVTTTTHKTLRGPRGAMILCNGLPSEPTKSCTVDKDHLPTLIDRAIFPGLQGGPHNHQIASIAVALLEASQPEFKLYGQQIVKNSQTLAKVFLANNIKLITDGTDNHLLLLDVSLLAMSGKQAEKKLSEIGIVVNKNAIPADTRPAYDPSGIRLGTPALTTRGMKEKEMEIIGQIIVDCLTTDNNAEELKTKVNNLVTQFPIY